MKKSKYIFRTEKWLAYCYENGFKVGTIVQALHDWALDADKKPIYITSPNEWFIEVRHGYFNQVTPHCCELKLEE